MYVRFNLDKNGQIHLEQLLTLQNSKGESRPEWEKVPMSGQGNTASIVSPLKMSGIFLIEEEITKNNQKQIVTHVVPALSITKIYQDDLTAMFDPLTLTTARTRFDVSSGDYFFILVDQIEFIKLLTQALSKFMIIKIDIYGNFTHQGGNND